MNGVRIGKFLRQVQHIHGHLWHRYFATVNQVMLTTVKLSKWWLQLKQPSVTEILIGTTSSVISDQLGNIYVISWCCWNVATNKWKNWSHLFCRNVLFLTGAHCQFRGVGQGVSRPSCICGILYFKLDEIYVINEITKPRII
jgi:hypothetical protein